MSSRPTERFEADNVGVPVPTLQSAFSRTAVPQAHCVGRSDDRIASRLDWLPRLSSKVSQNARLVASSHRRVCHPMGVRWKNDPSRFVSTTCASLVADGGLVDALGGRPDLAPVGDAVCTLAFFPAAPARYKRPSSIDARDSNSGRSPTRWNRVSRRTRSRTRSPQDERPCLPQAGLDNDRRLVRG